jgi:SAM-dependent methyltransferase
MRTYTYEPVERCVMCHHTEQRILGRRLDRHQGIRPRKVVGISTTVVQCRGCGLIFSNPRPVPESIGDHYEKPPEQYWRPEQLETSHVGGIPLENFRHLHAGRSGALRALDVGAGLGQDMLQLAHAGFDTWGLEPSSAFREAAITRGVDPERLQLTAVETAAYEPHRFDLISFGAVLEHLHDPAMAVEHALSWLAPGGLIFAEVPSARWLMGRMLNLAYRVRGLDYVTNLSPMHDPYHLYEFTREAFARHGQRVGYRLAHVEIYACETFLPKRIEPLAQRAMDLTGTGLQLAVWLTAAPGE